MIGVVITQRVKEGKGRFQKNGQFCSQPSAPTPSQHTQWGLQLESCVSQSVASGPPASESPEVLIKLEDPPAPP